MGGHAPATALRRLGADLGELLARHERGRDLAEFERWADDPVGFARQVLRVRLWTAQEKILRSIRDHPLTCVQGANAVGKDYACAVAAVWWVFCRRGLVLAMSATQRQAVEVVMAEVGRLFRGCGQLRGELFRSALRVEGAGGVLAYTSTEASRLTGFHGERVLGVLSEAQAIEPWGWEGMHANAVGPEDRIVAVGNPLRPSGPFFKAARSGAWRTIRIRADHHPNIAGDAPRIPGGPSRQFVERIAAEYGRDSGIYRSRVLGEFPEDSEEGLFSRSWLDAAAERWESGTSDGSGPVVVAVDVARYGPDRTVMAVRRGDRLEELVDWGRCDLMESVGKVRQELEAREIADARLIVDSVGLGGGLLDRLRELGHDATAYNGGSKARRPERFANRRAETYWRLRERLEAGEVALPRDEELFEELLATEWRPTSEGRVHIVGKAEIRSALGRSPDRADAVTMAFELEARVRPLVLGIGLPGDEPEEPERVLAEDAGEVLWPGGQPPRWWRQLANSPERGEKPSAQAARAATRAVR